MPAQVFELRTQRLGPLPLTNHYIDRLGLPALLDRFVPTSQPRTRLRYGTALGILLRSLLTEREPLYRLGEVVHTFAPEGFGLSEAEAARVPDDAIGRALDQLFDADMLATFSQSGTEQELPAPGVNTLSSYLVGLGQETTLTVDTDMDRELEAVPMEFAGMTAKKGLTAEAAYAGLGTAVEFEAVECTGRIAVVIAGAGPSPRRLRPPWMRAAPRSSSTTTLRQLQWHPRRAHHPRRTGVGARGLRVPGRRALPEGGDRRGDHRPHPPQRQR